MQSKSLWASPIVLVKKKDGSLRLCVDYRKVNEVTRKDAYPIPKVDDTLDVMAGAQWFSTLDLISGYCQVEVDKRDREKTAFCTPDRLNVMPLGLSNAPATFQRLMEMVLAGLQWSTCLVYLDDLVIMGKTFKEHLRHFLQRPRDVKLKLRPNKCHWPKAFLGHVISDKGIATDPTKTEKVAEWPVPSSQKEIQQFLGARLLIQRWDRLEVTEGVLWRNFEDNVGKECWKQLIAPKTLQGNGRASRWSCRWTPRGREDV